MLVARAYVDARQWQQALEVLRPVVSAEPDNEEALCLVSQCQLGLRRPELALQVADTAAALAPSSHWPVRLQAAALARLHRPEPARAAGDRAVALDPNSPSTHFTRAQIDLILGGISEAGYASAVEGIRLAPQSAMSHVTLGGVELVRRRYKEAEEHYRTALGLEPDNSDATHGLALVKSRRRTGWSQLGMTEAIRLMTGVVRTDPSDPRYTATLRRLMMTELLLASLIGLLASMVVLPTSGDSADSPPSPIAMAVAAAVCLVLQTAMLWRLIAVAGRGAIRFLLAGRSSGHARLVTLSIGLIALGDLLLVAGAAVRPFAAVAHWVCLIVFLLATLLVTVGAVDRSRR